MIASDKIDKFLYFDRVGEVVEHDSDGDTV